jgi:myosin heavy subunit
MSLLDEESSFPSATDETLITKFHGCHGANPGYERSPLQPTAFTIRHYAGAVTYTTRSFLEKNSDVLNDTVLELFAQTGSAQVAAWFARDIQSLSFRGTVKRGYRPATVGGQFRVRAL